MDILDIANPSILTSFNPPADISGGISDIDIVPNDNNRVYIIANNQIFVYLLENNGTNPRLTVRFDAAEAYQATGLEEPRQLDFSLIDIEFSQDFKYFYSALGAAGIGVFCSGTLLTQDPIEEDRTGLIIGATLGAFFGFIYLVGILLVGFFAFKNFYSLKQKLKRMDTQKDMVEMKRLQNVIHEVERQELIGSGHSGNVYKGTWKATPVALKSIKSDDDEEFQNEVKLLCDLHDPYVLRLFGVAILDSQVFMVTEYMALGDMKTYLQEHLEVEGDTLSSL